MWGVKHVEYWVTTDGRIFHNEEEANKWQEYLNSPDYQSATYCEANPTVKEDGFSVEEIIKRQLSDIKF